MRNLKKHNKYHPKQNNMTGLHIHLKMYSLLNKNEGIFQLVRLVFRGGILRKKCGKGFRRRFLIGMVKESLFGFRTQSVCSPRPKTGRHFIRKEMFATVFFSGGYVFFSIHDASFVWSDMSIPTLGFVKIMKNHCRTLDVFWRNLNQPISI